MKIAVTGGSGFIGKKLRALLTETGHECVNVDMNDPANPIDILDLPALTKAFEGCGAVYHLAAEHRDDISPRSRYYEVNVKGARHVTAAADANKIHRVIFVSSFAVYGLDNGTPDETSQLDPFNDYGMSKLEAEEAFQSWASHNREAMLTIVRPVVVFGEDNRGNVHTLISQIAAKRFLMIGDGKNRKSIAYVGNVVAFLKFILDRKEHREIYNYADGPDYTMNKLVCVICKKLGIAHPWLRLPLPAGLAAGYFFDTLRRITGRKFPISAVRVRKFCADTSCTGKKALSIGFQPPYTLEEGLARMIQSDFLGGAREEGAPKMKEAA
jgi:nucleoside-diphosphate-sugar epimerase